jgi:hypothetical protein
VIATSCKAAVSLQQFKAAFIPERCSAAFIPERCSAALWITVIGAIIVNKLSS